MNCQHCFSDIQTKVCYCPECGFSYHEECWRKNNSKCVQYGCKGKTGVLENPDDKKQEPEVKDEVINRQTNNLNEVTFRAVDKSKNNQQNIIYALIALIFLLVTFIFYFNSNKNNIKIEDDKKNFISKKDISIPSQKNNYSENNNKLNVKLEEKKEEVINLPSIKPSEIKSEEKPQEKKITEYKSKIQDDCTTIKGIVKCLLEKNNSNKNGFGITALNNSDTRNILENYIQNYSSYNDSKILNTLGEAMLNDLRNAWSQKDFDWYSSFYSKNFYGTTRSNNEYMRKNYSEWLSYKKGLFKRYQSIEITTELISAEMISDNEIKIAFTQHFSGVGNTPSSSYSDVDKKIIIAKIENSMFYIIEEKAY